MTTILIKRGAESSIPALADGEPGFTTDTFKLFVGMSGTNHEIGAAAGGTVTSIGPGSGGGLVFTPNPITGSGTIEVDWGTSTNQVRHGDDATYTDSRNPTGPAGGVLSGTYPNPGFAVDMATQTELDALAAIVVYTSDPRLTDARTPLPHAPTHNLSDSDPYDLASNLDALGGITGSF